ncbi:MAG: hypothetical protein ACREK8_02160 [Gemmatimonadales bacterium]
MTSEFDSGDPLDHAADALRRPVPLIPGLALRAAGLARRRHRQRLTGAVALVIVGGAGVALLLRQSGTKVTFAITVPAVQSVAVVGDFTDWRSDRIEMERTGTTTWQATVRLQPGRYRFAYLVNNEQWRADARAAAAPDDFGRPTSVLNVVGN